MADIGSLVVKLAAETAEFREDLGKSARLLEKHADGMRSSLERVADVAKTTFAIAIGVESVGALKELIAHTLESVAALQDFAEQTGASAVALSGFAPVATISGVAMEQISVGLTKLSKGLAGVDDETKGASQALAYLGIKAKDSGGNLRDPAEVMNDIALKLSDFEDGAGKTAIALELFGKSGATLLPFLKDLAANQDLNIRMTQAEIESAEQASKALGRMKAEHNFVAQTIVTAALPAMEELVGQLKEVVLGTHNSAEAMVRLRDDGSLKEWAQDAAVGLAIVIDAMRGLIQMVKSVIGSFEAVWADMELLGTFIAGGKGLNPFSDENQATLKAALEKRNSIVEKANQNYVDLWKMPLLSDAVKSRFDVINKGESDATGGASKPKLNYNSATGALTAGAMAQIESDIKKLQGLTDVESGILKDRQKIIDLYESQGYISYKEASEARLNAQEDFTQKLGDLSGQEETILKRGLATVAKTTQDKLKLQDKLAEITLRREKLERDAQQSNLEREIKLPGETLKDIQEQVARGQNQLRATEEQIKVLKDSGAISEVESLKRLSAARKSSADELADFAAKARELVEAAPGNDKLADSFKRIEEAARQRTLVKYLDGVNFASGTNSTADASAEFADDVYYIDRKSRETRDVVEFELARVAQEAPDSLRSKAFARVVDLVCEGEIQGLANGLKSVYLDDTAIQNADGSYNFAGVTLETRNGTQQQSYIPGFSSVENEVAVGVECKFNQPVVRAITDPDVDAVRIKISFPALTYQDATNGDLSGTTVDFAIDVQSNGGGYSQVVADSVSGKTTTKYQRSYYIPLNGSAPWDVRLRRITEDSTKTNIQNKTFLESYTEVIESKLRYPNSALMALRVDASQFSSIPKRSYDLKLLRVRIPSNYYPETRSYSGVWDGTFKVAWTDNPAWCFYDLVTSTRYGLGNYIPEAQVDKWALYRVARYCDEFVPNGLGSYEPRFTCNLYLQTREQAYKVVQDMASIFRGMAYWSGGAITVTQDAPQDAVYQFTAANVIDGDFSYQGSSAKARHTVALVSWIDPDDFYRQKVEYVEDVDGIARYGVVQADVVAMGCTSRGQANRVGKWLLYSEQSESEIITFRTGLEGAVVRPGDVIKVADASRGGLRLGGRISAATTVTVTLDQDPPAGSWRISVITPAGFVEERQVGSFSGRTLGVTSPFSAAPQPGAIWVLASSQVEAQLFRVVQVAESEPGIHEVTALAHNPSKYAAIEQGLALQPRDITVLSTTPATPTGLKVSESLYRVKDQAFVLIQVAWEQVFGALEYQVSYRVNGGNTVTLPRVSTSYLEIRNAETGDYVFTVKAVGVSGKLSNGATLSQTILGKLQPPDDVQYFLVYRRTTDLLLKWAANTDADLAGYEVRVGSGWDSGVLVGQTAGTQLVHDQSESGQYNYFIRAFDTSGKYSTHVTTFQLILLAPSSVRQFDVVQSANRLEFRWLPNPESEVVAYELREGGAWDTSIFVAEVKSSSYTLPSGFDGERKFWIKAIASPGIYSDEATFVSTVVAQPQNANLLVTMDAQATRFPGIKHFASVESVNSLDVLRMDSGVSQSEYLFEVNLPTSYRAQNTLLASIGATLDDRETWSTANYAWNSQAAKRQWTYDGALKSIEARFQIAREDTLQSGEIYGWRLNGVLSGYGSPTSGDASGVSYGDGRYGTGVLIKDTTKVSWGVRIPGVFHVSFWFIPNQVTTSVIWSASGTGVSLCVGYDAANQVFFLEDHLFNRIQVPYPVNASDRICIGVCQTALERRLFIGKMGGDVQSASSTMTPTAGYTALKLY